MRDPISLSPPQQSTLSSLWISANLICVVSLTFSYVSKIKQSFMFICEFLLLIFCLFFYRFLKIYFLSFFFHFILFWSSHAFLSTISYKDLVCMLSHFSHVQLFVTPWTLACQAPLSMEFSRQDYWSG